MKIISTPSSTICIKLLGKVILVASLLTGAVCNAQPVYNWAKTMGSTGGDYGHAIAVDAAGNVYTAGFFQGTVDFDPGPGTQNLTSAGGQDIFISKLDAAGNLLWAKSMGGASDDVVYSIAIDAAGNVYTTGSFQGIVDFDPGSGTQNFTSAGSLDIFVSKLDASGNFAWAKTMGGTSADNGQSIAVDASGNVYTTGYFQRTVDFDPGSGTQYLVSAGYYDIFISKLDASGNYVWAKKMGGTDSDFSYGIAVDASGNVYTTGSFAATADFDPGSGIQNLTSAGSGDIFISKLDASGNYVWAKGMGCAAFPDYGQSIAVDASGNVYTTGYFENTVDFDPGSGTQNLVSAGGYDIFVSKLDASGNYVWAKNMGGSTSDYSYSIALDASGNVYTTGVFLGTADFDPGPGTKNFTFRGGADIFISKLDASGNYVWAERMGGASSDYSYSIAVNGNDNVYTTGYFEATANFDPGTGIQNFTSAGSDDIFISHLGATALPLTWLQFQAVNKGTAVQLQWQTAQEQNTASFTVERSTDGSRFAAIGAVAAAGNSTLVNNYAFTDAQPLTGTSFYRLKMTDVNGQFSYSTIVAVRRKENAQTLQLFPNPVTNTLYIQANGQETATWQIADASGRIWQQQSVTLNGATSFSVNVQQLPAGNYYLLLKGTQTQQVRAFIKQ